MYSFPGQSYHGNKRNTAKWFHNPHNPPWTVWVKFTDSLKEHVFLTTFICFIHSFIIYFSYSVRIRMSDAPLELLRLETKEGRRDLFALPINNQFSIPALISNNRGEQTIHTVPKQTSALGSRSFLLQKYISGSGSYCALVNQWFYIVRLPFSLPSSDCPALGQSPNKIKPLSIQKIEEISWFLFRRTSRTLQLNKWKKKKTNKDFG